MARPRILNPRAAPLRLEPVPLSQAILADAKAIVEPGACAHLDELTGRLHGVVPQRIDGDEARIAFWTNLYNALILHCLCLKPLRGSLLWHLRMFDRIAYRVGDDDYPLNVIENGVLRVNRRAPLRLRRPLRPSDPRLNAAPSRIDPRIHFALNCGATSCPPIHTYDTAELDHQLESATESYLQAETRIERERSRVVLPRLLRMYAGDFGARRARLEFVAARVPEAAELLRSSGRVRVGYARFDWTVVPRPTG